MQTMQIDPARLLELRQRKKLSRPQLAEMSKVTERTIQRLEKEPQPSRKKTLERLATALGVKLDVLTGEKPLPESSKAPDSERIQINAQIAPKVKLAYDLIKRRYGVSATEIITMAPLFFALLAEGSLAWRREKLKELKEGIDRLKQIDGFWREYNVHLFALTVDNNDIETEKDSIAKADLFGEHLLGCMTYDLDPSTDNPFASYLRQLKDELDIPGVVDVDSGHPMFGSPLRFPAYDICRDELDRIANNSDSVKDQKKKIKDMEKGVKDLEKELKEKGEKIQEMVRTETYPEGVSEKEYLKLFGEAWKEEKEVWKELGHLREKHMEEQSRLEMIIKEARDRITSLNDTITYPEGDLKRIEEADSQKTNSEIEKGGDDQ